MLKNKTASILSRSASLLKEFTSKRDALINLNVEATVEQGKLADKKAALQIKCDDLDRVVKVNFNVVKNINKIIGE